MDFRLLATRELGLSVYRQHSAWAQYYEPGDIERLEKVGYVAREVRRMIEATNWSDDFWFPIPENSQPGTFQFERRCAHIELRNGVTVEGYVENEGHSICLFGETKEWVINANLLELHEEELPALRLDLGLDLCAAILPAHVEVHCMGWSFAFPQSAEKPSSET